LRGLRFVGDRVKAIAEATGLSDETVDEAELLDNRRVQNERIKIGLPHASVDAVESEGERQPRVDQLRDALGAIRLEIDPRLQIFAGVDSRIDIDAESASRLERIDDVKLVRPGFGKVFPGVGCGVGADEAFVPVGGRAVPIMDFERFFIVARVVAEDSAAGLAQP
jgi:hypothetical protein